MPRYWFADCEEILRRHDLFSVSLYRPKQGDHLMAQDDTAQLWREGFAPDFLATVNPLRMESVTVFVERSCPSSGAHDAPPKVKA